MTKYDERLLAELDQWLKAENYARTQQRRIVAELREQGCPWTAIGTALHMTKQGAHEKFNPRLRRAGEAGSRSPS